MSVRSSYPPGLPCWVGVETHDAESARTFYTEMFGWRFEVVARANDPRVLIASVGDARVAAIVEVGDGATRSNWATGVCVEHLDEAAQRATFAGGAVSDLIDVPSVGRFARLTDPAGSEIRILEPSEAMPQLRTNEIGAWSFSFLSSGDPDRALAFYGHVFGWQVETLDDATTLCRLPGYVGGTDVQPFPRDVVAAVQQLGPNDRGGWMVHLWSDDPPAAADRAVACGGRILEAPRLTEGGFRATVLADPHGAVFTVSEPAPTDP